MKPEIGDRVRFAWHVRDIYGEFGKVMDGSKDEAGFRTDLPELTVVVKCEGDPDMIAYCSPHDVERLDPVTELGDIVRGP